MKATRLPKLMVLFLLTAISVGVKAQVLVVHESLVSDKVKPMPKVKSQIDMNKYQLIMDEGNQKIYVPKNNLAERKTSETEMATVVCRLDYDQNVNNPPYIMEVLSKDYASTFSVDWGSDTPNTITCQVPIGIHDFITTSFMLAGGLAWIVKEEVNIKKDTTLIFNFDEAKNKYSVETYKPNGDLCLEEISEYSGDERNIIRQSNIEMIYDVFLLNLKGIGISQGFESCTNWIQPGNVSSSTMYINELSDRYRLTLARTVQADDTWYICKYETESLKSSTTLKNDPANFICYEEQFEDNDERTMMMGTVISLDDVHARDGFGQVGYGESEVKAVGGIVKMYVDAPKSNELGQGHIDILPYAGVGKRVETTYVWEEEDEEGNIYEETYTDVTTYPIYGLPILSSNKGIEYINASHDLGGNYSFHIPEDGDVMEYPGNPSFGYTKAQKSLPYGSGCPINSFISQNYFNERFGCYVGFFGCTYIGRYGEVRLVDLLDMKVEVNYNGKLICNSYGTSNSDMSNFFMEKNTDGVIDAEFINENVVVDELPGKNITNVHYNWGAEDMTAPTLQMLWFKNQDNNVIDRFDTGANGTLEFAGGDFNFHMLPDKFFFDCKEQTVQVNYSPYNKNEWAALEVEEVPENFYMPGFGYFYRGSLKDVEGQGEKGWFDLKIRLEDASGNWQEQVISPAFRIDDKVDTGIENNNQYTITNNNAVYDLMGRRMESQQKGISIVRRANGDVRKVVVK